MHERILSAELSKGEVNRHVSDDNFLLTEASFVHSTQKVVQ